ncbi:apolipoprotein N-acyltransferase [Plastoroseomonas arctica]|uniref:Apolipoprotein N-acyltransferase n=1 Tax=Plastoroseomonas arctica TaxID=1509237 RepID=A0AAF1JZV9_9PROT|nr:apolipoprotein N-acyltransferase [Plastoroseomonas arctica]MBR0657592.1 apolipoprotein N-acyltransferase [Plastoroseomonas arctica]
MKSLGMAFGLGLLAALALPPVHAVPVLLISIPGLLILIGRARSWRGAALIGLFWGWGQGIGGLYWITYAILTEVDRFWWLVPIAVPALALPFGAFVAIPAAAARLVPPGASRLLVFAGVWVLAELLRGVIPFGGFPWNLMGSVWAFAALPVQGAAYVGVHGLSLATILLAGLPVLGWRWVGGGGVVLAGIAGLGALRLAPAEPPPQDLQLLLVQGNVAQEVKWREDQRVPIFRRYLELTVAGLQSLEASAPGARVAVIWPEAASPFRLVEDDNARAVAAQALHPRAVLLAGAVTVEWNPDNTPRHLYNSLVAVTPDGAVAGRFDKVHLVPFGEYMPMRGLIPVRLVQGAVDFTSGIGMTAMAPAGLPPFSALICYEVIYPGAVLGAERPAWMVNITNDAWFGLSAGPYQHLAAARMRAVEEGLPIARAAQTGVSAVYDSRGREIASLGLGAMGSVSAPLPAPRAPTLFAHLGVAFPGALAFVIATLGMLLATRVRKTGSSASG